MSCEPMFEICSPRRLASFFAWAPRRATARRPPGPRCSPPGRRSRGARDGAAVASTTMVGRAAAWRSAASGALSVETRARTTTSPHEAAGRLNIRCDLLGRQKTEDRRQKTEDRRQKTETQNPEVRTRTQNKEDRRQKTEAQNQKTETEDRAPKFSVLVHGARIINHGVPPPGRPGDRRRSRSRRAGTRPSGQVAAVTNRSSRWSLGRDHREEVAGEQEQERKRHCRHAELDADSRKTPNRARMCAVWLTNR